MLDEGQVIETKVQLLWYAMSATFGRAMKAKAFLDDENVECFVPMRYEYEYAEDKKKQGKKRSKSERQLVPVISNLIFVHTDKDTIKSLKGNLKYLQYLTTPVNGLNIPIIVPDNQMQQFISVCNTHNDNLVYLSTEDINLDKGMPVRIIGGAFNSIEGTIVKVSKCRKKQFVVLIKSVSAVMVSDLSGGQLQPIK